MDLVNVKNLYFSYYNIDILFDIDLNVKENEKVLLIGSNGAGKSTLIRLLSGVHNTFTYKKFDVLGKQSPMDQFNGLSYLGNRWVRNISFIGRSAYIADIKVKNMMKKVQQENIKRRDELVEILDIDLEWRMHQVSDGQRKRVQIMLGLLKPFKLLLIDEFTSELDILVRDRFFRYLDKECKERNSSIIYATHILDNIDNWATHVIYISAGKCEKKKTIDEFMNGETLYNSVKNKFLGDKNIKKDSIEKVNAKMFGPQGGWSSGRGKNINL